MRLERFSGKSVELLASLVTDKEGHDGAHSIALLQQRLGITLQRENGRTALRRFGTCESDMPSASSAAWQEDCEDL